MIQELIMKENNERMARLFKLTVSLAGMLYALTSCYLISA